MCDMIGPELVLPQTRVLEPACGTGNFLVEILERKLADCRYDYERLRSVGSLYGVELLPDNVEICRKRLLEVMPEHLRDRAKPCIERNIVQGDFLKGQDKIWFLNEGIMPKEKAFDYEKAVQIDAYNLDKEWAKQPQDTLICMRELAEARKEYDRCKEAYSLVVAEVDREYRDGADKKPTEKALEGLVLMDARVQEASAELIEARYNVNMLEAAKSGLDNKREALTNLVKLHGMGYFAEPDADIEDRGKLDEMRQDAFRKKVKIRGKKTDLDDVPF